MKLTTLAITAGFVVAGFYCSQLSAQQTSTGAFETRTVGGAGGTTSPRSSSSSRSSGSGSSIGQGTGQSMMQQVTGSADSSARYIRNNREGQFVGAGNEDARAVGVAQAGGTSGNRNNASQFASLFSGQNGNLLGQFMQGQSNQGNQRQRSSANQLRIPIRMDAFDVKPIATSRFTGQFQKRLGKLPALTTVGPIEVLLEGETVVLRGVVASEGDRQLAQQLAMLEPEVFQVKNELKIQAPAGSGGEALPAPTSGTP